MVYDCFPFFNELEILSMRLHILDKHVDKFVLVESNKTFQDTDKPFYYEENKHLFEKFAHKIITHKFIDTAGATWNSWDRETKHRDSLVEALKKDGAKDDDIILSSDCDEIPNFEINKLELIYVPDNFVHMMQNFYYYYLNYQKIERWYGTKICSFKFFKERSFNILRKMKSEGIKIENGGWHWSYLSDPQDMIKKIESWAHTELNTDLIKSNVEANVKAGRDLFNRPDALFKRVEIDETFPAYIRDNQHLFKKFIKDVSVFTRLCNKYGTDKGNAKQQDHGYSETYDLLFQPFLKRPIKLLEIGVNDTRFPGASLKVFYDYFPLATIIGLDMVNCSHMNNDRITVYQGNTLEDNTYPQIINHDPRPFDIIIDDGCHLHEHHMKSFNKLLPSLKGIYIIEDLNAYDGNLTQAYFENKENLDRLGIKVEFYHNKKVVVIYK